MERPHSLGLGKSARHYDNDWLTVLAMLIIFFFHCARFFNFEDWHVKNNQLDEGMTLFVAIVAQWIMPLFFILSGISSYYSLKSRTSGRYIGNRFQRLVIPLIFGTFVLLIPVQVWIERYSHAQFDGTFIEFYPHYFKGFYGFGGNFAWMGFHLWYLEMLFVFTLLTFPLFIFLKKVRLQELISGAATFFAKNGAIFIFGIPLFFVEWLVNLQPEGVGMRGFGGWSPFSYLVVFVTGFLIAFDLKYREALERSRFISLALGLSTTSLMFFFHIDLTPLGDFVEYTLKVLSRSFNSWFWLVAFLGFGSRFLTFNNKILKYAREAVLPFYILHQTIIVVIGFYIVHWETSVMVKFFTLSVCSFIVIIAMYDLLIKRVKALRFLFGMQVKK
ncbi:MAG: acyltransferase family protein [Deltaproteobacteria bacterium]|nr:acyltransferase family protein [Deltaproteobacteria bacterium]